MWACSLGRVRSSLGGGSSRVRRKLVDAFPFLEIFYSFPWPEWFQDRFQQVVLRVPGIGHRRCRIGELVGLLSREGKLG